MFISFIPTSLKVSKMLVVLFSLLAVTACGSFDRKPNKIEPLQRSDDYRHSRQNEYFRPLDLSKKIKEKRLSQKTDYLLILVDESKKMNRSYKGKTRKLYLKQTLQNFQNSIPKDFYFKQEILIFGNTIKPNIHTLASLPLALQKASKKLKNNQKKSSILILSEWQRLDEVAKKQVTKLISNYPDLCIHMMGIGNIHNNYQFFGHCGQMVIANQLKQPEKMANFVEKLFFSGPADSDGDGIYDYQDKCRNTPIDIPITWDGCPRNSRRSNPRYLIDE